MGYGLFFGYQRLEYMASRVQPVLIFFGIALRSSVGAMGSSVGK
jgi:hypothetical protein